jgi:hypothetical protein
MTLALSKEEFLYLLLNFPEDNSSVNKDLIFTTLSLVHSEHIYSYTQQEINSIINKKGYIVSDFFEFFKNIPIKIGEENSDHVDICRKIMFTSNIKNENTEQLKEAIYLQHFKFIFNNIDFYNQLFPELTNTELSTVLSERLFVNKSNFHYIMKEINVNELKNSSDKQKIILDIFKSDSTELKHNFELYYNSYLQTMKDTLQTHSSPHNLKIPRLIEDLEKFLWIAKHSYNNNEKFFNQFNEKININDFTVEQQTEIQKLFLDCTIQSIPSGHKQRL